MLTMKLPAKKTAKRGTAAGRKTAKKEPRTLAELDAWFHDNWELVMERAKANTKRLTGRETL